MISIINAVNGVAYILIILFLFRMILHPREFYFSAILRPIDIVTAPVLKIFGKIFPPTRSGADYTPAIALILIYCLKSLAMLY